MVLSLLICLYFADRHTPCHCILTIWLSFFLAFSVVLLLPFDIANARVSVPGAGDMDVVNAEMLTFCWKAVYWTAFVMTWLVLGLQQRAISSGGFTFGRRLELALRGEARYYLISLLLFVVFVIVNISSKGIMNGLRYIGHDLPGFCTGLSHTTALLLLVFLLGFGLVELPRSLWRRADLNRRLDHLYMNASATSTAARDATIAVGPFAEAALSIAQDVARERERRSARDGRALSAPRTLDSKIAQAAELEEIARHIDSVVLLLRMHSPQGVVAAAEAAVAESQSQTSSPKLALLQRWTSGHSSDRYGAVRLPSTAELEQLHAQCSVSLSTAQRNEDRWHRLCDEAWGIEEILLAKKQRAAPSVWFSAKQTRVDTTRPEQGSDGNGNGLLSCAYCCTPALRAFVLWHWASWVRGLLCRIAAVVCAVISCLELLAFASAAVDPSGQVSLLALLLDRHSDDQVMIILLTFVPTSYMAMVVYFSLFSVRLFRTFFEMRYVATR